MNARTKRILLSLAAIFLVGTCGIVWLGYSFFSPNSSRNRAAAIQCTLIWGRLVPFPGSTQRLTVHATGGMFTRGFRCSFTATAADIEQWLKQSPGIRDAQPSFPSPGIRHFEIKPGGGAQWAEVTVDDTNHHVSIYVYWS